MTKGNLKNLFLNMTFMRTTALLAITISYSEACIIKTITNNSKKFSIVLPLGTVMPEWNLSKREPVIGPRIRKVPREVSVDVGIGEFWTFRVERRYALGVICREYRVAVDDRKKEILLQRHPMCGGRASSFETVSRLPIENDCLITLHLEDGPDSVRMAPYIP